MTKIEELEQKTNECQKALVELEDLRKKAKELAEDCKKALAELKERLNRNGIC